MIAEILPEEKLGQPWKKSISIWTQQGKERVEKHQENEETTLFNKKVHQNRTTKIFEIVSPAYLLQQIKYYHHASQQFFY